ncbi:MAG TPA: GNAT family N-acetyltransferase [Noviherbaspirillum sp.]|jgi:CelD/BcsL family acetyltransferase involved in cellulose biosynthesis|uniref:GNAT family N-acetyltransferase n=1 Tax=Noviherbaspirillum sp. TaxID=1926288 RepID=UPI002DDD8723|nr:GNAT family N-acetyltransferase [Noviherbaspirillum sp.]HEV2608920.1 GNAT family N-acetyltransferase [Noviherbaspirillum sp.]
MTWKIYPAADFERHQQYWQSINDEGTKSPLLDADFVVPLLREFANGNELLACYEIGDRIQAMGILAPKRRGAWETFQPSQAPIGLWTCLSGIRFDQALPALMRRLPGFPIMIGILQQDPALIPRPEDHAAMCTLDYIPTARIALKGSFDEYWNVRGKNLRQNMKKQRNKLEKEGISLHLDVCTAPEDVAKALAEYGALESAGWKAKLGTAIHPGNAQGRFYRSMLESFCRRGAGRIYRYRYNDKVVAMDLCIQSDTHLVILKTTYDESINDGTSPAFLLRQEQTRVLFEERGPQAIEFYGKVMDWHLKWTDDVRHLYHVNAYRFSFLSRVHGAMKRTVTAAG